MSDTVRVRCKKCDNKWETRYPLSDYRREGGDRRLKCPNCNQGKKDGFEILDDEENTSDVMSEDSVVARAQFSREKYQLQQRIETIFESIIGKPPQEYEKSESGAYRWSKGKETIDWWCDTQEEYEIALELIELFKNLDRVTEFDELERAHDHLDTVEDQVEVVHNHLERVTDLEAEIESKQSEIEELESEISRLKSTRQRAEKRAEEFEEKHGLSISEAVDFVDTHGNRLFELDELNSRLNELRPKVAEFEDKHTAYQAGKSRGQTIGYDEGYEDAREEFEVTYPCAHCNQPITVLTQREKEIVADILHRRGWAHIDCIERQRSKSDQKNRA